MRQSNEADKLRLFGYLGKFIHIKWKMMIFLSFETGIDIITENILIVSSPSSHQRKIGLIWLL